MRDILASWTPKSLPYCVIVLLISAMIYESESSRAAKCKTSIEPISMLAPDVALLAAIFRKPANIVTRSDVFCITIYSNEASRTIQHLGWEFLATFHGLNRPIADIDKYGQTLAGFRKARVIDLKKKGSYTSAHMNSAEYHMDRIFQRLKWYWY